MRRLFRDNLHAFARAGDDSKLVSYFLGASIQILAPLAPWMSTYL